MKSAVTKTPRNGKIELLRFLFAILVILLHTNSHLVGLPRYISWQLGPLAPHGAISVEFFFLVSGFLMPKAAYKSVKRSGEEISSDHLLLESAGFIKRKLQSIFPYHLIAFVFAFTAYMLLKQYGINLLFPTLVKSLPNLFLYYMVGVRSITPNPPEWYLSAMLIAMALIYPLLRKHYYKTARIIAPLIGIGILVYLYFSTHSLSGVGHRILLLKKGLLRAIAELLLGAGAFEFSRFLSSKEIRKPLKIVLTVYELLAYPAVIVFAFTAAPLKYSYAALTVLTIAVPITFSNQTSANAFFNNKVCYWLGDRSFYIYISHMFPVFLAERYMQTLPIGLKVAFIFVVSLLVSFVVEFGGKKLIKARNNRNKRPKATAGAEA